MAGLAACSPRESPPTLVDAQTFELQRILDEVQRQSGVPGMAAAWARTDGPVHAAVAGVRAIGSAGALVQIDDHVRLGAASDAFVGGTVLSMVTEGRLQWDSTVQGVLKDLAARIRPEYRSVTVEQLLTHRVSIAPMTPSDIRALTAVAGAQGRAMAGREAIVQWALTRPPVTPPVTTPGPSTGNPDVSYLVAAHMAERADNTPFETALLERVLKRMGVPGDCAAASPDGEQRWFTLAGHVGTPAAPVVAGVTGLDAMPPALLPIADVRCSISSLAQFARTEVRALRGTDIRTVFSAENMRRLYAAPSSGGRRIVRRTADAQTFAAQVTLLPDDDLAIVVAGNAGYGQAACERLTRDVAASLGVALP